MFYFQPDPGLPLSEKKQTHLFSWHDSKEVHRASWYMGTFLMHLPMETDIECFQEKPKDMMGSLAYE